MNLKENMNIERDIRLNDVDSKIRQKENQIQDIDKMSDKDIEKYLKDNYGINVEETLENKGKEIRNQLNIDEIEITVVDENGITVVDENGDQIKKKRNAKVESRAISQFIDTSQRMLDAELIDKEKYKADKKLATERRANLNNAMQNKYKTIETTIKNAGIKQRGGTEANPVRKIIQSN